MDASTNNNQTPQEKEGYKKLKELLSIQDVESFSKKPQNMDQMITLYMEMHISHKVMESRIQKLETRFNTISSLLFKHGEKGV
jgi:hypothetical protein